MTECTSLYPIALSVDTDFRHCHCTSGQECILLRSLCPVAPNLPQLPALSIYMTYCMPISSLAERMAGGRSHQKVEVGDVGKVPVGSGTMKSPRVLFSLQGPGLKSRGTYP